jgi:hypothetical protein
MIEAKWLALEAEASDDRNSWRLRLARRIGRPSLFVSVEGGRRHLRLRCPRQVRAPRKSSSDCLGSELVAVNLESRAYFGVSSHETRLADVFAAVPEDRVRPIESTPNEGSSRYWWSNLRFLAAGTDGRGQVAQRGSWGALHKLLMPELGCAAVYGWMGQHAPHQDSPCQKVAA